MFKIETSMMIDGANDVMDGRKRRLPPARDSIWSRMTNNGLQLTIDQNT
jgi:hypothetical protein